MLDQWPENLNVHCVLVVCLHGFAQLPLGVFDGLPWPDDETCLVMNEMASMLVAIDFDELQWTIRLGLMADVPVVCPAFDDLHVCIVHVPEHGDHVVVTVMILVHMQLGRHVMLNGVCRS